MRFKRAMFSISGVVFVIGLFVTVQFSLATHESDPVTGAKICHSSLQDCARKLGDLPPTCPIGEQCMFDGNKYRCVDQSYKSPLTGKNSIYITATPQCKEDINNFSRDCQGTCSEDPRYGGGTYDKCRYPNDPTNKPIETYSQLIERRKQASCLLKRTIKPPPPSQCRNVRGDCEEILRSLVYRGKYFIYNSCRATSLEQIRKIALVQCKKNGLFGGFSGQGKIDPCEGVPVVLD